MANADTMRTGEVATLFGKSPRTINRWAQKGLLPATRSMSGQWEFDRAAMEALKTKGEV